MGAPFSGSGGTATAWLAAICFFIFGQATHARDDSGWDRFSLSVAGFRPDIKTHARLDTSDLVPGTELNLENDLNVRDSDTLWQALANFRVTDRIDAELGYLEIGRSGRATLDGEVRFGDTTFPFDVDAKTVLSTDIATMSLRYALLQNERVKIAASAGVYLMQVEAGITADSLGLSERADAEAPMPLAGMAFGWNITPKLELSLHGQYLSVDIEDFDGSIGNVRAGLLYKAFETFGLGLGYDVFDLDVESEVDSFPGMFEYQFHGPKAFVTMRF
jgi:hypothetical protein